MGLYLGSNKKILRINNERRRINLYSSSAINGTMLKSSDGYILKDSNGLYLTTKESE